MLIRSSTAPQALQRTLPSSATTAGSATSRPSRRGVPQLRRARPSALGRSPRRSSAAGHAPGSRAVIAMSPGLLWADAVYGILYAGLAFVPTADLGLRLGVGDRRTGCRRSRSASEASFVITDRKLLARRWARRSTYSARRRARDRGPAGRRRRRRMDAARASTATPWRTCSSPPAPPEIRRASWARTRGLLATAEAAEELIFTRTRLDAGRLAAAAPRHGTDHAGDRAGDERRPGRAHDDRAVPAAADVVAAADQRPSRDAQPRRQLRLRAVRAVRHRRAGRRARPVEHAVLRLGQRAGATRDGHRIRRSIRSERA